MTTQHPQGLHRPSARPTRQRMSMTRRLTLLGVLTGSLGLGIVVSSATAAPAPAWGASVSALAAISPVAPVEGVGGPWLP